MKSIYSNGSVPLELAETKLYICIYIEREITEKARERKKVWKEGEGEGEEGARMPAGRGLDEMKHRKNR